MEKPEQDPVEALVKRHGVRATYLRWHGSITPGAPERLLEGVIQSVLPRKEGRRPVRITAMKSPSGRPRQRSSQNLQCPAGPQTVMHACCRAT